jgi:hypothetical protein
MTTDPGELLTLVLTWQLVDFSTKFIAQVADRIGRRRSQRPDVGAP